MFSIGWLQQNARMRFNRPAHLFLTGFFYNYIKFFLKSQALIKRCRSLLRRFAEPKKNGFFCNYIIFFLKSQVRTSHLRGNAAPYGTFRKCRPHMRALRTGGKLAADLSFPALGLLYARRRRVYAFVRTCPPIWSHMGVVMRARFSTAAIQRTKVRKLDETNHGRFVKMYNFGKRFDNIFVHFYY